MAHNCSIKFNMLIITRWVDETSAENCVIPIKDYSCLVSFGLLHRCQPYFLIGKFTQIIPPHCVYISCLLNKVKWESLCIGSNECIQHFDLIVLLRVLYLHLRLGILITICWFFLLLWRLLFILSLFLLRCSIFCLSCDFTLSCLLLLFLQLLLLFDLLNNHLSAWVALHSSS